MYNRISGGYTACSNVLLAGKSSQVLPVTVTDSVAAAPQHATDFTGHTGTILTSPEIV